MKIEKETENRRGSSYGNGNKLLTSFCMAILAFLTVILSHQLLLGTLSYALGYETHITFGKVTSLPFENKYWSSNRVLFMYAMPAAGFLFTGGLIAIYLLMIAKTITRGYWYLYWCMVFSILFITSQFAVAPLAALMARGPLYQGISVVTNWWGVESVKLFVFSFLAFALNILFGVFSFRLLIQLSPSRQDRHRKSGQQQIIVQYFILPLLLLLPVALFLSYPDSMIFTGIMFLSSLLWLPGYFMKTQDGYHFSGSAARVTNQPVTYTWLVAIAFVIILIRIFL